MLVLLLMMSVGQPASAPVEASSQPVVEASSQPTSEASSQPTSEAGFELPPLPPPVGAVEVDTVSVIGTPIEQARIVGAAYSIDQKKLETFNYTDIHRALAEAPGVYVREEDGFGLRPNIGMRGVSSDRSSKIALMEDGVLLAPAPYSAPAAYYFPMMSRIVGVEVFKGPAAIKYGPQTVGGALNMVSRHTPRALVLGIDLTAGMYGTANGHAYWGIGNDLFGLLVEGSYQHTDGFKTLPSRERTGFDRGELMIKASANTPLTGNLAHRWDVKGTLQYEISNETYLGLSDADFAANPYQRYAASADDVMRSWRSQVEAGYLLVAGEMWEFSLKAYRHDQSRQWKKFNGFEGVAIMTSIFSRLESETNREYLAVLKGEADSSLAQRLLIGTNDRRFVAQGVQAAVTAHPVTGPVKQDIELGLRFHHDSVDRVHDDFAHIMFRGEPVVDDPVRRINADELAQAFAFSGYLQDQLAFKRLLVVPGIRLEYIHTDNFSRTNDTRAQSDSVAVLPGIGVYYGIIEEFGVLAGVHRGFSPRSPGQSGTVQPEYSVNYEAGARARWQGLNAEAIGFVNDYSNLTGDCTFSSGCADSQVNQQFNGGAVLVYGVEAAVSYKHLFEKVGVELRAQASYTLTLSQFRTAFESDNPQWGSVEVGDHLPYVPEHQANATLGVSMRSWGVDASVHVNGEMRDVPGQGAIAQFERISTYAFLDLAGFYVLPGNLVHGKVKLTATLQNVANTAYMVSRRPFGARPGIPITFMAGINYTY